eukprot:2071554-Amphidinium_carterae.1
MTWGTLCSTRTVCSIARFEAVAAYEYKFPYATKASKFTLVRVHIITGHSPVPLAHTTASWEDVGTHLFVDIRLLLAL